MEVIMSPGWGLHGWDRCHSEGDPSEHQCPFCFVRMPSKKIMVCELGGGASPDAERSDTLVLDFPAPRL